MIAQQERATSGVWCWEFSSPLDLKRALEEYTAFQEGAMVRRYGADAKPEEISAIGQVNVEELARVASRYGLRLSTDEAGAVVYGEDGHPRLEEDPEAEPRDPDCGAQAEMSKARIRAEIDACMDAIRRRYPHWWTLLEAYYRQGASLEPRGWVKVAELLGSHAGKCPPLKRCPASPGDQRMDLDECRRDLRHHCGRDRALFVALTATAIARLFDAHRGRFTPTA